MLTPELKKKKSGKEYIYYHCNDTHKKGCKKLSYISQTSIDEIIIKLLKSFSISKELFDSIKSFIKEIHDDKHDYQEKTEASITRKIEQVNKRIRQAYEDKCDGTIDEDFWREINKSYHAEKTELIEAVKEHMV